MFSIFVFSDGRIYSPGANSRRICAFRRQRINSRNARQNSQQKFAGVHNGRRRWKNGCRRQKRDAGAVLRIFRRFANFVRNSRIFRRSKTAQIRPSLFVLSRDAPNPLFWIWPNPRILRKTFRIKASAIRNLTLPLCATSDFSEFAKRWRNYAWRSVANEFAQLRPFSRAKIRLALVSEVPLESISFASEVTPATISKSAKFRNDITLENFRQPPSAGETLNQLLKPAQIWGRGTTSPVSSSSLSSGTTEEKTSPGSSISLSSGTTEEKTSPVSSSSLSSGTTEEKTSPGSSISLSSATTEEKTSPVSSSSLSSGTTEEKTSPVSSSSLSSGTTGGTASPVSSSSLSSGTTGGITSPVSLSSLSSGTTGVTASPVSSSSLSSGTTGVTASPVSSSSLSSGTTGVTASPVSSSSLSSGTTGGITSPVSSSSLSSGTTGVTASPVSSSSLSSGTTGVTASPVSSSSLSSGTTGVTASLVSSSSLSSGTTGVTASPVSSSSLSSGTTGVTASPVSSSSLSSGTTGGITSPVSSSSLSSGTTGVTASPVSSSSLSSGTTGVTASPVSSSSLSSGTTGGTASPVSSSSLSSGGTTSLVASSGPSSRTTVGTTSLAGTGGPSFSTTTEATPGSCVHGYQIGKECVCYENFHGSQCELISNYIRPGGGPYITKVRVTVVAVNILYSEKLSDKKSSEYQEFEARFKIEIRKLYGNVAAYSDVRINSIRPGSVVVEHDVLIDVDLINGKEQYHNVVKDLYVTLDGTSATSNATDYLQLDSRKTQIHDSELDVAGLCSEVELIPEDMLQYFCGVNDSNILLCASKCSSMNPEFVDCNAGQCSISNAGPRCFCKTSGPFWYTGDRCEYTVLKTGVIVGVTVGVLVFILVFITLLIFICRRRRNTNKERLVDSEQSWSDGWEDEKFEKKQIKNSETNSTTGSQSPKTDSGEFRPALDKVNPNIKITTARAKVGP
ncbi:hypothetical protein XELAEV_18019150mg [Xenopus laevis]|uniref:SEA domain-containing protein n=1 Tax=Xenopus laevis TaxID=8355 RepID=A0A974DFI7_XENLA|nr:hypothetical protein XELAEV_18019150mg [Xenopus laevis]